MWRDIAKCHVPKAYSLWNPIEQTLSSEASHILHKACNLLKFITDPLVCSLWHLINSFRRTHGKWKQCDWVCPSGAHTKPWDAKSSIYPILTHVYCDNNGQSAYHGDHHSQPITGFPYVLFLASLSFIDTIYSTIIAPKMITDFLHEKKTISFQSCMTQIFIDHLFSGAEVILLVVMAYDQYVAICKPLHYLIIMNQRACVLMLLVAWNGGILHSLVQFLLFISSLSVAPMSLIISCVICTLYWNLLALIPTSLDSLW